MEGVVVDRRELKVDRDLLVLKVDVCQFGKHPLLDVPEVLCIDPHKNSRLSKYEGGRSRKARDGPILYSSVRTSAL